MLVGIRREELRDLARQPRIALGDRAIVHVVVEVRRDEYVPRDRVVRDVDVELRVVDDVVGAALRRLECVAVPAVDIVEEHERIVPWPIEAIAVDRTGTGGGVDPFLIRRPVGAGLGLRELGDQMVRICGAVRRRWRIIGGERVVGKDVGANYWREEAAASDQPVVSPIHPRFSDDRLVTDIVAAVRAPDRTVLGFVADSVLIERIGKRLSTVEFSDRFVFQVLDQRGAALFANDFKPNPRATSPESSELLNKIRSKSGHFEYHDNLYSFSRI